MERTLVPMLLVIFGAGASYDSVPHRAPDAANGRHDDRLPLANELFDNRPEFVRVMMDYEKSSSFMNLVPLLQRSGADVEAELEKFQKEATTNPRRVAQLTAIRFYIQVMISECQSRWMRTVARKRTNYRTLLERIEHWRMQANDSVCLITFNYDTLIEDALSTVGVKTETLQDYVTDSKYKLVKLHGSINWARRVESPSVNLDGLNLVQVANELITRAQALRIGPTDRIVNVHPDTYMPATCPISAVGPELLFPAIAIPVQNKSDEFECPRDHFDVLMASLPKVDKVLIVGWRSQEAQLLSHLKANLRPDVPISVVAGSQQGAQTVIDKLNDAGVPGKYTPYTAGFTGFALNRVDPFLGI